MSDVARSFTGALDRTRLERGEVWSRGMTLDAPYATLFDCDGVLMDVAGSFRAAITRATQLYATLRMGFADDGEPVFAESWTHGFKLAGGFNSDWDLAIAATLWLDAKRRARRPTTLAELRDAPPSLDDVLAAYERAGRGGLTAFRRLVPSAHIDEHWLIDVIEELYAGSDNVIALYGHAAVLGGQPGYCHAERVILDATLLPPTRAWGVQTGRFPGEWAAVVERLPESLRPFHEYVVVADGTLPTKPDPAGILALCERMNVARAVYVGDTLDDLRASLAATATGRVHVQAALVCTGPYGLRDVERYVAAGADWIARDVNDLLRALAGSSTPPRSQSL